MALRQLHSPISVLSYCTLQALPDVDGHRHNLFCYKTNLHQNCSDVDATLISFADQFGVIVSIFDSVVVTVHLLNKYISS